MIQCFKAGMHYCPNCLGSHLEDVSIDWRSKKLLFVSFCNPAIGVHSTLVLTCTVMIRSNSRGERDKPRSQISQRHVIDWFLLSVNFCSSFLG